MIEHAVADALTEVVTWARSTSAPAPAVLRALTGALIERQGLGLDPDDTPLAPLCTSVPAPCVPADLPVEHLGAALLGHVHEALLAADHRHRNGVFYTPDDVATALVGLALGPSADASSSPKVCDPAMGGGAFLLAAGRALEARGGRRDEIVERGLWGVDIDPVAVAVAATALVLWAAEAGAVPRWTNLVCADSLAVGLDAWTDPPADRFDAVVGNPPFLSQLGRDTARTPDAGVRLRERFGAAAYRYADTAALFLLESCDWVRPGGRVVLVLPQSVLVADDAAAVRTAVLDRGVLEQVWVAAEPVFAAGVRVCAPTIRVGVADPGEVHRSRGRAFASRPARRISHAELRASSTWGAVTADLFGVPEVSMVSEPTLASFCSATAGFRDQFYGVQPFVHEQADIDGTARTALLVTSGLIDPARCLWGRRQTRFGGRRWDAPVLDVSALDASVPGLGAWTRDRLVPKLLVATQTRVLEAAVDERGEWFPSVPTIAVTAPPDRLWHAAAVVMAPPISAWAMGRHAGAALSDDAIKVSARQLLDAPLPEDTEAWAQATDELRAAASATDEAGWRGGLYVFGATMVRAYRADTSVLDWWFGRLPAWR